MENKNYCSICGALVKDYLTLNNSVNDNNILADIKLYWCPKCKTILGENLIYQN